MARMLGCLVATLAIVAAANDIVHAWMTGNYSVTNFGEIWSSVSIVSDLWSNTFGACQGLVCTTFSAVVTDLVTQVQSWPGSVVIALSGLVFLVVGLPDEFFQRGPQREHA